MAMIIQSRYNKEQRAFSISELLACCCAAPDPSQEYKLFSCVCCEVYTCTEQTGSTALN